MIAAAPPRRPRVWHVPRNTGRKPTEQAAQRFVFELMAQRKITSGQARLLFVFARIIDARRFALPSNESSVPSIFS